MVSIRMYSVLFAIACIAGMSAPAFAGDSSPIYFDSDNWATVSSTHQDLYIDGMRISEINLKIYSSRKSSGLKHRQSWAELVRTDYSDPYGQISDSGLSTPEVGVVQTETYRLKLRKRKVNKLNRLLSLVDWGKRTVLRHEYLCDSNSIDVSFMGNTQTTIDYCGATSMPRRSFEMEEATRILNGIADEANMSGILVE